MNICIAVKILKHENGGVCTHILDLCRYYISEGHKVVLLADGTDYKEILDSMSELVYEDLPFATMGKDPFKLLSVYNKMRTIVKKESIDIIHLHGQSIIPVAWMLRVTTGIPFLWTNHIDAIPQPKLLSLMHKLFKFPIISVSNELKKDLMERLKMPDKDLYVIPNGTNFDDFQPLSENEKTLLRQQFDICEGEFVIAELARLTFGKGQDLLIRAVKRLQEMYPESHFHVLFAGTGHQEWFEENVMKYAKDNNIKATYLGFQKPRDVFGMANISVLPSLYEGFSLGVLESLAMECPVIRSNTPGWSHMKDITLVFEKGNITQLLECLDEMFIEHDKWEFITRECQNEIRTMYSKEQMGKSTLEVYAAICGVKQSKISRR